MWVAFVPLHYPPSPSQVIQGSSLLLCCPENSPYAACVGDHKTEEEEGGGFPPLKGSLWKLSQVKNQELSGKVFMCFDPDVSKTAVLGHLCCSHFLLFFMELLPIDPSSPSCICQAHTLRTPYLVSFPSVPLFQILPFLCTMTFPLLVFI